MDVIFKIVLIAVVIGVFVSVFCWTFDIVDYFANPNTDAKRTLTMRVERTFDNMKRGMPVAQFEGYVKSYHLMSVYDIGVDVLAIFDIDVASIVDFFDTIGDGMKDFFSKVTTLFPLDKAV